MTLLLQWRWTSAVPPTAAFIVHGHAFLKKCCCPDQDKDGMDPPFGYMRVEYLVATMTVVANHGFDP
jgi:hypothetical protein